MDERSYHPQIRIKRKYLRVIQEHSEKIQNLFSIRISDKVFTSDVSNPNIIYMSLDTENKDTNNISKAICEIQNYVDALCLAEKDGEESLGGEDSSYDSDFDVDEARSHHDVSRTVSDTLGAEYADYVSTNSYTAKVEFGLKLGYTEKLVQAALSKLGPNPGQNELLAELIKLGAQSAKLSEFDSEDISEVPGDESCNVRLRRIVIDGSNVAMSHGNKEVFSCRGIKLCVDWFKARGHKDITVFVPKWRKEASRPDNPITNQEILSELERERLLVFTPSRFVLGKRTVCYDDRYVLKLAAEEDGIVVSNDNYRDLAQENPEFRKIVEERTLMYSFVNDRFMPPDDPLGRSGPTLDNFLRIQPRKGDPPPPCPYGKKCTYGNKCKYHHPERGSLPHKSVTERLVEHAQKQLQARGSRDSSPGSQLKGKSLSVPLGTEHGMLRKVPLSRTKSIVPTLVLPDNPEKVCKSKSVENITGDSRMYRSGCVGNVMTPAQAHHTYWGAKSLNHDWSYSQQVMNTSSTSHTSLTQRLSDPESSQQLLQQQQQQHQHHHHHLAQQHHLQQQQQQAEMSDMAGNLHRKLQRQLTLNPSYDPRLYQIKRYVGPNPPHLPVERHCSGGDYTTQYWEQHQAHQNVTRIASAPDSYRPAPSHVGHQRQIQRMGSTSDPQLNLCVPDPYDSSTWLPQQPVIYPAVHMPSQSSFASLNPDEARRKLHYHLASIFPEEQVRAALQLYPDETNPQKICAAILAMFPKP